MMRLRGWCWAWLAVAGVLFSAGNSRAALIPVSSISGQGGAFNGSLSLMTDGSFPPEGQHWQQNTVWWHGTGPNFVFDFGALYNVDDVTLSVDNNDGYMIDYSADGVTYSNLLTIQAGYGEIGGGMDTMTSISDGPEYIAAIDFATVQARYLKVYAINGDNSYSVGEIQAFGSEVSAAVPEPTALTMLGFGAFGLAGYAWRRRKATIIA